MKKRIWLAGGCLIVLSLVGLGVYSYYAPGFTLQKIKEAARRDDRDRLRELIDFDSVKTALKDDIRTAMLKSAGDHLRNNPFAGLGVMMVNMMVDPMVEMMVSPAGLSALMKEGRVESTKAPGSPSTTPSQDSAHDVNDIVMETNYDEFSRYRVRIKPVGKSDDEAITFILRREGLFSWRLTRVSLPPTVFANAGK